jgi:hypothetical protein
MIGMAGDGTVWRDKAKALDVYRWRLLRERYSAVEAILRFARDAISDFSFGLRARCLLPKIEPLRTPCDFLLLQSAPKVIAFQRKKLLIEALQGRGYNLVETALEQQSDILAKRLLVRPRQSIPLRYFGYAAYAEWLAARYDPKILLNDRNGSLYSPFLRLSLNACDRLLVHLAHATTVESSRRLGMHDYDYYFLFGLSSFEALQARVLRFGESTAVLAGSHMVDATFDLPPASPEARTVLILGVGPDKEKESAYQRTYELLRNWAAQNDHYRVLVKSHPRSQAPFWQAAAATLKNLQVLPCDCGLAQALAEASIVINVMSNAVIEAALARRPVVFVNASPDEDIFAQERFFDVCVSNTVQLNERIAEIETDYAGWVCKAEQFADFHLAQGSHGLQRNVELLEQLLQVGCCEGVHLPSSGLANQGSAAK